VLEIPVADEKRFELRTRLLKIKVSPYRQPYAVKIDNGSSNK
jgi:hypothetical protein